MKKVTGYILILILISLSTGLKAQDWEIYRGKNDLSGQTEIPLPAKPGLLWTLKTDCRTVSSPVVYRGNIYFGNNDGDLIAVEPGGKIKWKYETGTAIEASPLVVGGKIIVGSLDGVLRAIDAESGKLLWQYETGTRYPVQPIYGLMRMNQW